ncbi:MAG: hypothetical protein R3F59_04245 [Myxococcota bacterium]
MTAPSLDAFFAHVGGFLEGGTGLEQLEAEFGPVGDRDGLAYYAWLVKFDQMRILGELYPLCRTWLDRVGTPWEEVVAGFVAAHRPTGWSVPHLGEHFADWLLQQSEADPARFPVGVEALADLVWTRFLARNAPDGDGLGLDRRVFVRQYRVDAVGLERAVHHDQPVAPFRKPSALLVYRHASGTGVFSIPASLATIALLVTEDQPGAVLPGVLGQVGAEDLAQERIRLAGAGVL